MICVTGVRAAMVILESSNEPPPASARGVTRMSMGGAWRMVSSVVNDTIPGMPARAGASGQTDAAYGETAVSTCGVTWLPGGFSTGLKQPKSVCITHSPKIHAPTTKPKESVA